MPQQEANRERIYHWIVDQTPPGGRVLDIGCGEGDLLALLVEEKAVRGSGLELSEACVMKAVQRGLSVHHEDVEQGLDDYSDASFDLVLLSLTIQELRDPRRTFHEALRIGKQVIVVLPNFGYWLCRCQLFFRGIAPKTDNLPYTWYESPNRHFLTLKDWEGFLQEESRRCIKKVFLCKGSRVRFRPNLMAEVGMYLLEGNWTFEKPS